MGRGMNTKLQINKAMKGILLPTEVKSYELVFSEDSSGAPAVFVNLRVDDDKKPSKEKIDRLRTIRKKIALEIVGKQAEYYPYVRFVA